MHLAEKRRHLVRASHATLGGAAAHACGARACCAAVWHGGWTALPAGAGANIATIELPGGRSPKHNAAAPPAVDTAT